MSKVYIRDRYIDSFRIKNTEIAVVTERDVGVLRSIERYLAAIYAKHASGEMITKKVHLFLERTGATGVLSQYIAMIFNAFAKQMKDASGKRTSCILHFYPINYLYYAANPFAYRSLYRNIKFDDSSCVTFSFKDIDASGCVERLTVTRDDNRVQVEATGRNPGQWAARRDNIIYESINKVCE